MRVRENERERREERRGRERGREREREKENFSVRKRVVLFVSVLNEIERFRIFCKCVEIIDRF